MLSSAVRLARPIIARAASTLVLVESTAAGTVAPATYNAATAARALGGDLTYLVPAASKAAAAPVVAALQAHGNAGEAYSILVAPAASLAAHPTAAETLAPLVARAVKATGAEHVVAPASAYAKNAVPRAAALMDVAAVSDVVGVVANDTFTRPIYAGNAIATVKSTDGVKVITVRTTAFDAAEAAPGTAPTSVETLHEEEASTATSTAFVAEELVKSDRPTLDAARVVVAGGRALKSAANFAILEALADKLGGAVGASRAAVDAGYADNSLQIGQTGKVVAPELYIGAGISGAIQHLAGMKDSKVIVAINKDADAPIFQVADYGLVADLFEAVPEMTGKL
ncbi:DHS-like NAD/FAD-binding domain-containing protein [Blastocladiella britannica]|nr:DHS-like NAD/FAD-binding domain-containing protein [Blastocladiella britannica]